ncbi:MAG: SBBP repeat-containing protein, partial [Chitinophagaceae bacterium]|nr:SBBP repeat-containing protein [Chitinophagaceae bacterium]
MKKLTLLINGLLAVTMLNAQPPPFQWAQGIGGISNDQGRAIAVDASGNVYTAGYFIGNVDFDPGPGQSNLTSYANSPDIFILKLNASGSFAWVKRIGGLSADLVNSMVIDPSGNIYTTGTFQGTVDFDPGPGSLSLISAGMSDIFVTKLDASGNFIWAKKIGGINQEEAYSIAVDDAGNVCTTGGFTDTLDFNPGPGVTNLIARGGLAAFILKLNSSGNFVWARSMDGDSSVANGTALKFDVSGNIHTTGNFYGSIDLDPGLDTFNVASDSWGDIFVLKLDSLGNFVWGKNIGLEESKSITLDVAGDIYVTGSFSGQIFVAKIDVTGNTIWTKILSVIATTGMDMSKGHSIVADESGHIYITGEFNGKVDFDPGAGTYSLTAPSQYIFYPRSDAFILKLDSDGYFQWAKQMGSEFDDAGLS